MIESKRERDALLAKAWKLTGAIPAHRIPRGRADGQGCSFRLLDPIGTPRIEPAAHSELARHCAGELGMLLKLAPRAAGSGHLGSPFVPTVVPAALAQLVECQGVRQIPVSDEDVLAGPCPVTWMAALRLAPRDSRWVRGLVQIERNLLALLCPPVATVETAVRRDGDESYVVDAAMASKEEGMTALARGQMTIALQPDGFSLGPTKLNRISMAFSWDTPALKPAPDLPNPRGRLTLQVSTGPIFVAVLRDLSEVAARSAALLEATS